MQKKSTFSTALWFIPLLAILLAVAFVFIYWVGRMLLGRNSMSSAKTAKTQQVSGQAVPRQPSQMPIIPAIPVEQEEVPIPQEVLDMENALKEEHSQASSVEVCPATSVPVKIKKPTRSVKYTPYERGLRQCNQGGIFPCAWEDKSAGVIKQYWLMGAEGPITRGVYDIGGNLLSETIATINGTVTSHTDQNITWYFEGGILVKIRTSPYDNCNFHDWFFINEAGQQDVCQCAYTTPDCCARSPYQEGKARNYCKLFPLDKDFCNK